MIYNWEKVKMWDDMKCRYNLVQLAACTDRSSDSGETLLAPQQCVLNPPSGWLPSVRMVAPWRQRLFSVLLTVMRNSNFFLAAKKPLEDIKYWKKEQTYNVKSHQAEIY